MDSWFQDDTVIEQQPRSNETEQENPFVRWLVRDAWKTTDIPYLLVETPHMLHDQGLPLQSIRLFVRTLNPQLYGLFFNWDRDSNEGETLQATHKGVQSDSYRNSPFAPIINGEGGVRRRLDVDEPELDFPILTDLLDEGATDYVALPIQFSDGQINTLSLVSDMPGGFSTSHLGYLYEILPHLGRLIEAQAQRLSSLALLQTYLGRSTGERVLSGRVKRGDGEDLDTIIWFSDLRNSTRLADTMTRDDYLAALDQYFDCVTGAVMEHGGEVLKFIGDAVLAIFPIDDAIVGSAPACNRAHAALCQAYRQMERVNEDRAASGGAALAFGTGLHRGNITYGNIGTNKRLDFTVIGPAVNEASRIEGLCKTLDEPVLASSEFAREFSGGLTSLGEHQLQGVKVKQEIFKLDIRESNPPG
tara:strand:- start:577 stop:1827 length:1251 start_codon:yes stop_codon:yes gene_type:complete